MPKFGIHLICLCLLLSSLNQLNAQTWFITPAVGYAWGAFSPPLGSNNINGNLENNNTTLGKGLYADLVVGYMFNRHLGVMLGGSFLFGEEVQVSRTEVGDELVNLTSQANKFQLVPALIISTGGERTRLYSRVGLVFPVTGRTLGKSQVITSGVETLTELKINGGFSVGFHGGLGVAVATSEHISLIAEIQLINLNIFRNKAEVQELSINGQDVLPGLNTFQREIDYKSEISPDDNIETNPNVNLDQPRDALTEATPFSSLGINIGVMFRLNSPQE
ncbi:outer membrane beta-barrel protein [Pontibacter sp. G13]|uniref:outer membrane beta-barrel protein n=1 Tax=Pontibacter sp. G13 TaxID=3074898 RepID=UPI00288AC4C5|nr:outer membrane beta-barrel protein [Pontibacter sp. G13]WNJ19191.1 outer membrane beta-barrel protein [Pontibacter sp. G13]